MWQLIQGSGIRMTISSTGDLSPIVSKILHERGIFGDDAVTEFFSPKPQLAYDPFLLVNMEAGVDLLISAIDKGSKIAVYGDYDVDGVTSTALLIKTFGYLTDNLTYYIPDRQSEGYGLNCNAIDKLYAQGVNLIVTVDCGAVSRDETIYAHTLGIDTIVTDHHNIADIMAEGIVINPRMPGNTYPFKYLAGVGVAYKFALAVAKKCGIPRHILTEVLEMAAVGTVADMMPLVDENRTIVKYGLRLINAGCINRGLKRLIERAGMKPEDLRSHNISFGIAPLINAAGRIDDAAVGVKLLLSDDPCTIEACCDNLIEANKKRREFQEAAYNNCMLKAEKQLSEKDFLIIEADPKSHEGILGIVAGNIKEKINRPVVIISKSEGDYKGTGRSTEGVDLFTLLNKHKHIFKRFGGHKAACGFLIGESELDALRDAVDEEIKLLTDKNVDLFDKHYNFDAVIEAEDAGMELAEDAALFEPCGIGNEVPLFRLNAVRADNIRRIGRDGKYMKFNILCDPNAPIEGIVFHDCDEYKKICEAGPIDIIGNMNINKWKGKRQVQMVISALFPHMPQENLHE